MCVQLIMGAWLGPLRPNVESCRVDDGNHEVILHLDCGVGEGTEGWSLFILLDKILTHSLNHSLILSFI